MPRFSGIYIDDDGDTHRCVFDADDKYAAKAVMGQHGAPQSLEFVSADTELVLFHDEVDEEQVDQGDADNEGNTAGPVDPNATPEPDSQDTQEGDPGNEPQTRTAQEIADAAAQANQTNPDALDSDGGTDGEPGPAPT